MGHTAQAGPQSGPHPPVLSLGPGQTGLIPNAEMGTAPGTDHRAQFKPGTPIEVEVLAIEEDGKRISLSRKSAQGAKEREEYKSFKKREDEKASGPGFSTMASALKDALERKKDE